MPNELVGVKALSDKLNRMERAAAIKTLRSAVFRSTTRTVTEMKAKAPRGRGPHRTYKGRLVAPGFLSRSIRRRTKVGKGKVTVSIGVRKEAFYGVAFLDEPVTVTARRRKAGRKGTRRAVVRGVSRAVTDVKPYRTPGARWFKPVFRRNAPQILADFKRILGTALEKA